MAWLGEQIDWMYWTWASAVALALLGTCIGGLALWDRLRPAPARRGFLPIPTTRGDRFFIGMMSMIGIHLIWLAFLGTSFMMGALMASLIWFAALFRWG